MTESVTSRLFTALQGLEQAVLDSAALKASYRQKISELTLKRSELEKAVGGEQNQPVAQPLIDDSVSQEIDLSISQLKNLLAKKRS
jgi:hypothetical protein